MSIGTNGSAGTADTRETSLSPRAKAAKSSAASKPGAQKLYLAIWTNLDILSRKNKRMVCKYNLKIFDIFSIFGSEKSINNTKRDLWKT